MVTFGGKDDGHKGINYVPFPIFLLPELISEHKGRNKHPAKETYQYPLGYPEPVAV